LGDCNISTHDFALAERYFHEALREDNTHQRHLRGFFKALQAQQKYEKVIEAATHAIVAAPKNGNYRLDRALALWKRNHTGDRDAAVKDLKVVNDLSHGKNAQTRLYFSWFLLDQFLELQGQGKAVDAEEKLQSAVRFLKAGIKLCQRSFRPVLRNQLSLLYMYLGDSTGAMRETAEGLKENAGYVTNYLAHVRALTFAGKFTDAYRMALEAESHAPMLAGQFWSKFWRPLMIRWRELIC